MSDPVDPNVSQSLADQAALAGAAAQVGQVTVGVLTPDSPSLITPRTPRDIRPQVVQKTNQVMQGTRDRIRAAMAAATATPPPADPPTPAPVVDLGTSSIPASLLSPPADPTTPTPVDLPPPPEVGKDPKAAHAWAQIRKESADAKRRAEAAEADAAIRAAEALKQTELAARLKAERDEIEGRLQKTNLLESPAFKARYDGKITEQRALLANTFSQVMEPAQVDDLVNRVLTSPPKEFGELLGKVPPWAQQLVLTTRAAIHQTSADREKAVADWRTTRTVLAEQEARDGQIKLVTELESETAKAVENAVKSGNYMLKQTGDPAWDAKVAERIAKAKTVLAQPRSRQDIVDFFVEGVTAPETRAELVRVSHENASLRAQLAGLGARPASAITPASPQVPVAVSTKEPVKMRDFVAGQMTRIGAR